MMDGEAPAIRGLGNHRGFFTVRAVYPFRSMQRLKAARSTRSEPGRLITSSKRDARVRA